MPVDPGLGERLASRVADVVAAAELDLLRLLAETLRDGIGDQGWIIEAIGRVQQLRTRLAAGAAQLDQAVVAEITATVTAAYNLGSASALVDLDAADVPAAPTRDPERAVARIAATPTTNVQAAVRQLPDLLTRTYTQAVQAGVNEVLGGEVTRRAASQHVLDRLASEGVTGYRDAAGRRWSLTTYAEMAVRTGAGQAAVQGHVDSLSAAGLDLVVVSDAPRECPLCRPFEGKVLSISGEVGDLVTQSVVDDSSVRVKVVDSVAGAKRKGLQHPNCRHSLSAYLPGATRPVKATSDPAGYEATQKQRYMERKVREWKRRQAVALDDAASRQAASKVRQWQSALRDHVDRNDLTRKRHREQVEFAT